MEPSLKVDKNYMRTMKQILDDMGHLTVALVKGWIKKVIELKKKYLKIGPI